MPSPTREDAHVATGPPNDGETSDWEDARPLKRKRVALACSLCRERKVKCDGAKPVCTPCNKRGSLAAECVYTVLSRSAKQMSEREYVAPCAHARTWGAYSKKTRAIVMCQAYNAR